MHRFCYRFIPLLALVGFACNPNKSEALDTTATTSLSALGVNGNFESGDLTGWNYTSYFNHNGVNIPPQSFADLQLDPGPSVNYTHVITGATESVVPVGLDSSVTLRVPKFGGTTVVINERGKSHNVNALDQTVTIGPEDIDPADGLVHLRLAMAPVLNSGGHAPESQPFYWISVENLTTQTTLFTQYNYSDSPGTPWQEFNGAGIYYTDWAAFDVAPGNDVVRLGDQLKVTLLASGCSQGGHWGQIYAGGFGAFLPGPAVSAHGPQLANSGNDVVYSYHWRNGAQTPANNANVTIALPDGTTYVAVNAPAGVQCTEPTVGSAGILSCNLGTLPPGSFGSFTMTVNIPSPTALTSIDHGNYKIFADGISSLLGPTIHTTLSDAVSYSDLSAILTDNTPAAAFGQVVTYTLVVANAGPADVVGAPVTETLPPTLTQASWTCVAATSASCASASGSGAIATTVDLPANTSATFTIHATVAAGTGTGTILHTIGIEPPAGGSDPDTTNNTAVDADFTASTLDTVTVTKTGTGVGHVRSSPQAIDCGATCSSQFASGSSISLSATAGVGFAFLGWSGACAGQANPCILALSGSTAVSAEFDAAYYTTVTVLGGVGTVTCTTLTLAGDTATCTVAPGAGNSLTALSDNGVDVLAAVNGNTYLISNIVLDHALVAGFTGAQGGACVQDANCATSHCVDAVCCDTTCTDQCGACDVVGSIGTCVPVVGLVHGARQACGADFPGSACGGACDGNIADGCVYPAAGTPAATTCMYKDENLVGDFCDGGGYYEYSGSSYSGCNVGCAADAVHCGCTDDSNCLTGQTCTGGICVSCAQDSDCGSGQYCIDQLCAGQRNLSAICTAVDQCSAGICGSNGLCGLAVGDPNCTADTASTVCQSAACSPSSGFCVAVDGQCWTDGDCTDAPPFLSGDANYCARDTGACTAVLATGTPLPTDGLHDTCSVGLNDACVTGACNIVTLACADMVGTGCVAGASCAGNVCGSNQLCGLVNGQQGCSAQNANLTCQSGACGTVSGVCIPVGGCNLDGDCSANDFCVQATATCTARLALDVTLPTDAGHATCADGNNYACLSGHCNPSTLTCAAANGLACSGAHHCASNLCGSNGLCGLADGQTGCTPTTAELCQSATCGTDNTCRSATGCAVTAECPLNQWCDVASATCRALASVGYALPSAACVNASAPGICASGLCNNVSNTCAVANGQTCKSAADCAGNACATDGLCGHLGNAECTTDAACRAGKCLEGHCNQPPGVVAVGNGLFSCAASGTRSGGPEAFLLLAAIRLITWGRQRRRALVGGAVLAGFMLLGIPAQAATEPGFRLTRYTPSEAGSRWLTAESLAPAGSGLGIDGYVPGLSSLALRLDASWGHNPLVVRVADGPLLAHVVGDQTTLDLGASIQVLQALRVSLGLPLQVYATGVSMTDNAHYVAAPSSSFAVGDLHVAAMYRIDTSLAEKLHLGVGGRLWLPTGSQDAYAGNGSVSGDVLLIGAGEADLFVWSLSLGVDIRRKAQFASIDLGTALLAIPAVGVQNAERTLLVGVEVPLSTVVTAAHPFKSEVSAIDPTLSVNWRICPEVGLRAGIATGLTHSLGEGPWRGMLGVEYRPVLLAPAPPPVVQMPPPPVVAVITTPAEPAAPVVAPVAEAVAPAPVDSDHDGVLDPNDVCPQVAGDPNRGGCPEPDADGDGVPDAVDTCPSEKGTAENAGCQNKPAVRIVGGKLELGGIIKFETGKDVISKESYTLLDSVVKFLETHPNVAHMRIEGYTDNQGKPAKNLDLSKRRAKSVLDYLVAHKTEAGRVTSTGFGQEHPVAPNETADGRAANRRVDFVVTDSP